MGVNKDSIVGRRIIINGMRDEAHLIDRRRRIDTGKSMLDVMVIVVLELL